MMEKDKDKMGHTLEVLVLLTVLTTAVSSVALNSNDLTDAMVRKQAGS